jgi:hypothetical protein
MFEVDRDPIVLSFKTEFDKQTYLRQEYYCTREQLLALWRNWNPIIANGCKWHLWKARQSFLRQYNGEMTIRVKDTVKPFVLMK